MPAPTNDNFTNAYGPLDTTLPASIAGTTFDATTEGSEPSLFGGNEQSVWYYFTPASTGWYKFWIDDADIRATQWSWSWPRDRFAYYACRLYCICCRDTS